MKKSKRTKELLQIEKDLQRIKNTYSETKDVDAIKKNSKYSIKNLAQITQSYWKFHTKEQRYGWNSITTIQKVFSNPTVHTERNANEDNGINKISTANITENNLIKVISELSQSATAGPDGFPALLLKQCKIELAVPLRTLWSKKLKKGTVPEKLKKMHNYFHPPRQKSLDSCKL